MSTHLINHSPDLKRLRDEGYSVYIKGGVLVIEDVPYVTADRNVTIGTLVSTLALTGQKAAYNGQHVVYFSGDKPCHGDGRPLQEILHTTAVTNHGNNIITQMSFSSKPRSGYKDYYHKMTNYINILTSQARVIDPAVTARVYRAMQDDEASVFNYVDTNSSRASITPLTEKFIGQKIGIIGLGGTGSYILDFVAKTPVAEIHLFDGDKFFSHNAFRAPGAPSLEELSQGMNKVEYLHGIYSRMRNGIFAHALYLEDDELEALGGLDFVFISIDGGKAKAKIFDYLEARNIPFVDVGMGLTVEGDTLRGSVRTTVFAREEHRPLRRMIDFGDGVDDAYSTNIQIAELNAFNATIAVIKWKQHLSFYQSLVNEGQVMFTINTLGLIKS